MRVQRKKTGKTVQKSVMFRLLFLYQPIKNFLLANQNRPSQAARSVIGCLHLRLGAGKGLKGLGRLRFGEFR